MKDDLVDILLDFLPDEHSAQETADLIRTGRGQAFLPELVWDLTNYRSAPEEAEEIWAGVQEHGRQLESLLGRSPGLRVTALDYFINTLGRSARPRVAHPELLEHLFQQATNDALTGLANRRFFRARFHDEQARADRYKTSFAFLLFDLDDFKKVNDTKGHAEGDRVLVAVADIIRASIRESDVGARWGGEEFAVLMPETTQEGASLVAERIREQVREELAADKVTLSGGLAVYPQDGATEEALFQHADRALYRAKEEGKDRIYLTPKERREHPRLVVHYPLHLAPVGAEQWALVAETRDVSHGGIGLEHDQDLWVADEVEGRVEVGSEQAHFRGRVTHVLEAGEHRFKIGVAFTSITPEDGELLLKQIEEA